MDGADHRVPPRGTPPAGERAPARSVREDELLAWSGTRMAKAIRDGERTSEEIVRALLAHVDRVNPLINAVVQKRPEAIADARRADAAKKKTARFHGVPCTIKESFAVDGLPLTA